LNNIKLPFIKGVASPNWYTKVGHMMLLRVVRPMKRPESSKHYFRQWILLDVLEQARGVTLSLPLGEGRS